MSVNGETTEIKETVEWSGQLLAGGKVSMYKGKNKLGVKSAAFMRWDGYLDRITENGNDSEGINWRIVFDHVDESIMKGKLMGFVPEGKGEGTIVVKRTGNDSYRADWNCKLDSGGTMTGVELNKRK